MASLQQPVETGATREGSLSDGSPTTSSRSTSGGSINTPLISNPFAAAASNALRGVRLEIKRLRQLRKPRLFWELICLVAAAATGTAILISLLYLLIFVLHPQGARNVAPGRFIANYPLDADGHPIDGLQRWTEDFSRSVVPIMCHSHNDYWREYPLYSALAAGCTGIEADVWLSEDGTDLLVGHDRETLSPERSLRKMYIEPLLDILNIMNPPEKWSNFSRTDRAQGVFRSNPNVTIVFLLDVKDDARKTWPLVMEQLQPLRDKMYLYRYESVETSPGFEHRQHLWPGPVTVVGTGDLVDKRQVNNKWPNAARYAYYHDAFLDAPLGRLPDENTIEYRPDGWSASVMWDAEDAYYTSVSFQQTIGSVRTGFSKRQLETLRRQIETARWSNLKTRYWDLPSWPISYRDYVWEVLSREGVGMLNIDDLASAEKRSWTTGYIRDMILMVTSSIFIFLCSVALAWYGYRAMKRQMEKLTAAQRQPIMLE